MILPVWTEDELMQSAGCCGRPSDLGDRRGAPPRHSPMRRSMTSQRLTYWFIDKLAILVEMEQALKSEPLTVELLQEAKRIEFPDNVIARPDRQDRAGDQGTCAMTMALWLHYKMVDTCAAEFAAETPYYYSVFGSENEAVETSGQEEGACTWFRPDPYRPGYRV